MVLDWVFLSPLRRYADAGLLALRLLVGAFLVWSVWSNIYSENGISNFAGFLRQHHAAAPDVMAPLTTWLQFSVGLAFIFGLFTRWAGVLCAVNFIISWSLGQPMAPMQSACPAVCLVAVGLYLALRGCGRFGLDTMFERPEHPTLRYAA